MPSPAAFPSVLTVSGQTLQDANGYTMPPLKGLVVQPTGKPLSAYSTIAAKGAQIVRTVVFWQSSTSGGHNGIWNFGAGAPSSGTDISNIDATYIATLDQHIANCFTAGMYTLFTLYWGPGTAHTPTWNAVATYSGSAVNVTTLTGTQSLATTSGSLSGAGFPASGILQVPVSGSTPPALVTYTGLSGGNFTGCAYYGGPTGTIQTTANGIVGGSSAAMSTYVNYGQSITQYLAKRYGDPADPQGFWSGSGTSAWGGTGPGFQPVVIGLGLNEITPDYTTTSNWVIDLVRLQATSMMTWMRAYAPNWLASVCCGFGASAPIHNAPGSGHSLTSNNQTFTDITDTGTQAALATAGGNFFLEMHDYELATKDGTDGRNATGGGNSAVLIKVDDTSGITTNEDHTQYPPITGGSRLPRGPASVTGTCQADHAAYLATYVAACSALNVPLVIGEFGWAPYDTVNASPAVAFSGETAWITDKMAAWAAALPSGPAIMIQWDWQTSQANDPWAAQPGSTAGPPPPASPVGVNPDGWQAVTDIFFGQFTVQVTDSATPPNTDTQVLSITIGTSAGTLTIQTKSLIGALRGNAYSAQLAASGGTGADTWSITARTLPAGLHLHAATGVIDGTPTGTGTSSFTVQVTDSASPPNTASAPLSITVSTAPAAATPAIPGQAQPGTFTPGLQGTFQPLEPLFTIAIPAVAQPGMFAPGDPGSQSLPPMGPGFTPAAPGQAEPGLFTPGDPGPAVPEPAGVPFIAQQVFAEFTYNYGWSSTEFSGNSAGNMLVVMAGWDLNATGTSAPMPAAYVCDSSLNYWYHAGTTSADNTGSRCSIWVAPNAQPVEWVSCSLTTFASSLAYTILEIGNAPQFFTVDVSSTDSSTGGTTLDASPGLTGSADIGLAMLARGSGIGGLEVPPAGWTELGEGQAGFGVPNAVQIYPFWNPAIPAGTDETVAYLNSDSSPLSAVTVLIEAAPYAPVQPNPNLPAVKVEAAFGFTPGDPSQSPPQWTDITNRCSAKEGSPYIQPAMGKAYELATPETGELLISCDNHDGAFTPGNIGSPYAPGTGVMLGTPVRVSAYWAGSWYNIAFGYIERWPQEWPDIPQWGMSAMIAADAFSALSAAVSYSALNGDLLLDAPYALIPCNEQYTTQSNSLNTFVVPSECQGLLASNISRFNQRPGTYVDGIDAAVNPCQTGQSTTLLGSQDTGFGNSSFTPGLTLTSSGPGMIYWDPALPSPLAPSGLTVEFWLTIPLPSTSANTQPTVFTAFSAPSNYQTATPSLQVQVQNYIGNNILQVTLANGSTMTAPFSPSPNPQQVALVFSPSTVSLFVNGALAQSAALSAAQAGNWAAVMLGCGNYAYHNGTLVGGAFTAMSLAIYPYQLPLQRIVSHYVTGVSGQQGVGATTRIAQVLAWTALGIPRGGQITFNGVPAPVQQGPAYSLSGSNVSDALNQVAANEQGLLFTSPDGTLQFMHRWALFNQAPSLVFGDNEDLGEIPFLPGQAFDFDNTYLYNIVQATQAQGPTTGITVTSTDTGSEASYFNRSILQVGIQTVSNLDAYDLANQAVSIYSQPSLRLRGLTVDAAANPLVAFPGVLGLQQGNAATVNRRPVGGAPISANVIVQKVSHNIGPAMWQTSYEMSPYPPLNAVLQLDAPGFDVIGQNSLP